MVEQETKVEEPSQRTMNHENENEKVDSTKVVEQEKMEEGPPMALRTKA